MNERVYETEFVENDHARNMDFYRKLRAKTDAWLAKHPKAELAGYIAVVPDIFYLIIRLAADTRVSPSAKLKLAGAAGYFMLPIDIIPDFIPVVGWLDDLIVAVTLLNRALDSIDSAIVDEYWVGDTAVYDVIKSVLDKGDKLVGSKAWAAIKKLLDKMKQ